MQLFGGYGGASLNTELQRMQVFVILRASSIHRAKQMLTSGFLKTAIAGSLLVHAAGLGALVYFQRPGKPITSEVVVQQPVLLVVAALEEPAVAETASSAASPQITAPATPQVVEVPPAPEPERVVEPAKPVQTELAAAPEPPAQPAPEVQPSSPPTAIQPVAAGSSAAPVAIEKQSDEPGLATSGGESILTHAHPNYRRNTERIYPREAIRRGEEGLAIVMAVLDDRGIPQSVSIKKSSGHQLLDDAAVRAVKTWEFEPARVNGKGIQATVEVPVNFKLTK